MHQVGGFVVSEGSDDVGRKLVLGIVNHWVQIWMGHVLQWVWLHRKDNLRVAMKLLNTCYVNVNP